MAAQFTGVTWIGGGTVNLENEEIRIRIAPRGRRGVPTGSNLLARMVGIGGTLSHPRMVVNPTDVALNYGRYLAFFSTGGLSLLAEGLFDLFRANRDVCRIILKGSALDFNNDPESAPE